MTTSKLKKFDISLPPEKYKDIKKQYEYLNEVFYGVKTFSDEMLKPHFDPELIGVWENINVISPGNWLISDFASVGLPTNFYDNHIFYSYAKNLSKLQQEHYDIENLLNDFKEKLLVIWNYLPYFYNGLSKMYLKYYIEPPENYDKNKPYPQYSIISNVNNISQKNHNLNSSHGVKPFDPKSKLKEYLNEDKAYKSIIQEIDKKILNHKWQYWVKNPVDDINYVGLYSRLQVVIGDIERFTKQMYNPYFAPNSDNKDIKQWLEEKNGKLKWDWNFYQIELIKPFYNLLQLLTNNGYDVQKEWHILKKDIEKYWFILPKFHTGISDFFPQYLNPMNDSLQPLKINPFIIPTALDNLNIEKLRIIRFTPPNNFYKWTKKFNPTKPLLELVDKPLVYKKTIDFIDKKVIVGRWSWVSVQFKYSAHYNQLYECIKSNIDAINSLTEQMRKYNLNSVNEAVKAEFIQEVEDYLDFELEGPLGWSTNFYENVVFDPFYDLLISLSQDEYDVRPQWKEFRSDMKKLWETLPDFYKGLGKESQFYIRIPANYDKNKPFPQYPIPEDID